MDSSYRIFKGSIKSRSNRSNPAKRVLFFGLPNVGKSSIMEKLCDIYYTNSTTMTAGLTPEFHLKLEEQSPCLRRLSIATADAVVLTYALDDIDSFQFVTTLLGEITETKGSNFPLLVAANKSNLEVSVIYRIIEDRIIVIGYGSKQIDTVANAGNDSGTLEIMKLILKHFTEIL